MIAANPTHHWRRERIAASQKWDIGTVANQDGRMGNGSVHSAPGKEISLRVREEDLIGRMNDQLRRGGWWMSVLLDLHAPDDHHLFMATYHYYGFMDWGIHGFHGWWIRETAYSDVVALIHDFEASSNIYQIANRDHRSAPETCRLGFVLNQALKSMWNLECAQK